MAVSLLMWVLQRVRGLLLLALVVLFFAVAFPAKAELVGDSTAESNKTQSLIELRGYCPAGFQLDDNNQCILQNLYRLYPSLQGSGVGGLKTGLAYIRDGFSPQQIDLGRYLFFDPMLSADDTVSCASCHHPKLGFSDGNGLSVGIGGQKATRSAPSLWNVGLMQRFFWDGRAQSLEQQMEGPLFAAHEMGNTKADLLGKLNQNITYRTLFALAYPGSNDISEGLLYNAIAAFQTTLISLNSRYDQYAHGYHDALNEQEKAGLNVFRSFVARCAECHTPPLFTNQQMAVLGTPEPEGHQFDRGQELITNDPSQRGSFKVPSLRNIELTAPYMHSGRFPTLREAAEFYTKGRGHAVPEGETLKIHWHIWNPQLPDYELDQLVAFMKTLTDVSFTPDIPTHVPSGLKPVGLDPTESEQLSQNTITATQGETP